MWFEVVKLVAVDLFTNRILAVKSSNIGWTLPGGKRQVLELTPKETLKRELLEELGVTNPLITRHSQFEDPSYGRVVMLYTLCWNVYTKFEPGNEIIAAKWMSVGKFCKVSDYWDRHSEFLKFKTL